MTSQTDTALPRRLLLATDLSCRCDRALDRAVALCREWQAELVVVHALEQAPDIAAARHERDRPAWHRAEDRAAIVEAQLRRDLAEAFVPPRIVVEEGDPAALVLKVAQEERCDLVVAGLARSETFGRLVLGSTVDALARAVAVPLLVVKERPHGPYDHVLVATDFSDDARAALRLGALIRPERTVLFHAFDPPFSGWVNEGDRARYLAEAGLEARRALESFLAGSGLPEPLRATIRLAAEHGSLSDALDDHVRRRAIDLVVLGLPERGRIMEALIGNRATAALDALPCDILLVGAPRGGD